MLRWWWEREGDRVGGGKDDGAPPQRDFIGVTAADETARAKTIDSNRADRTLPNLTVR